MKDALLIELAQTWELQASTGGDGSNMLQPATRETLRQCADILRMLVAAQPAASSPAPTQDPQQPAPVDKKINRRNAERLLEELMANCEVIGYEKGLAAASSPAPAVQPEERKVHWPVVTRYSGGAISDRVWLRLGDGPEETEYAPAVQPTPLTQEEHDAAMERISDALDEYDAEREQATRQAEAVAELVKALRDARPYVESATSGLRAAAKIRDTIDALIAKHGQQGGSNA